MPDLLFRVFESPNIEVYSHVLIVQSIWLKQRQSPKSVLDSFLGGRQSIITSFDCNSISMGFCGICETHNTAGKESDPGGPGVCNLTSSFDNTAFESKMVIPAPLRLDWTICLVIDFKKAFLKAIKS